jgi:hypothetical protein
VPPGLLEFDPLQEIAAQLETLAAGLRGFRADKGVPRTGAAAQEIVSSLKTVNATLADAARRGSLGSEGFTTVGREFGKIGKTLQAIGSGSRSSE